MEDHTNTAKDYRVPKEDYTDQVDKYGVIYRNFTVRRSGVTALGTFLQDLLTVNGSVTFMYQIGNWPKDQQRYVSTDFRLKFRSTDHLDRFHKMGYTTSKVRKVNLDTIVLPEAHE
jgi:hypothetical protein